MSGFTIPVDAIVIPPKNNETVNTRRDALKATYKQLFKENRALEFFLNTTLDSAYLEGKLSTRQLVRRLLSSEMYRDYILLVNSNSRFVELCFERVLGRPASHSETMTWSSFLATEGLDAFAEALTSSKEYIAAFGDDSVPARRSAKLSSSNQGLPSLPAEASQKRYNGPGLEGQRYGGTGGSIYPWKGSSPPVPLKIIGVVLVVAGVLEVSRILLTIISSALTTGL